MDHSHADLAVHRLHIHNTGRLTSEEVVAAFLARGDLLGRLIADLAAESANSRPQHHLLVGQRGMGKTMLLHRLAAEIGRDPDLRLRFLPLLFMEEQYTVDRLSKFWMNCLDSLADALERAGEPDAAAEIDDDVSRFERADRAQGRDDARIAEEVYRVFHDAVTRSGKRAVLLVDNLQLVFDRCDSAQHHALREILMRGGAPILIGASPSVPPDTADYGAAFYDFLKLHFLKPLSEQEMRDLLAGLAKGVGRSDVLQRVLSRPERLRVLRQLTGGNPRTTVTLFLLYLEDFAPSVFADLERLLDRVSPLYKARLEELSSQQQVIVGHLADHWAPISATDLATHAALPTTTISGQLDRLVRQGVVEAVPMHGSTSSGFQLAERFFNVWFLFRSASRRRKREVEFLARFLEQFYEATDRHRLARSLLNEASSSQDRLMFRSALAGAVEDPELGQDLERHSQLLALEEKAVAAQRRVNDWLSLQDLPPATMEFAELQRQLASLVPPDLAIAGSEFAREVLGCRHLLKNGDRDRLASRTQPLAAIEIESMRDLIRANRDMDIKSYGVSAVDMLTKRLSSGQIRSLRDADDWKRTLLQVSEREGLRLVLESIPHGVGIDWSEADLRRIFDRISQVIAVPSVATHYWALVLQFILSKPVEAESVYRRAIELDVRNAHPWNSLGNLLQDHLGHYSEAESAYRRAIELDARYATPWNGLGNLLLYHLGRHSEAESAYRRAIELDARDAYPWNGLGNLFADFLGRPLDAVDAYRRALDRSPGLEIAVQNLVYCYRDYLRDDESAKASLDAVRTLPHLEFADTLHLHEALFAAYDRNWGLCREDLVAALDARRNGFASGNRDDWIRATAVLLHLGYGADLIALLEERGDDARLRPWFEAIRAHMARERDALRNVAVEVRPVAEWFFDQIELRLRVLPAASSRREAAKPPAKTSRRRKR